MQAAATVIAFLAAAAAAATAAVSPVAVTIAVTEQLPTLDMSGFAWAENMAFDGRGSLFVSDAVQGILYRVFLQGSQYQREAHLQGGDWSGVDGLAASQDGSIVFAVVGSLLGSSRVLAVDAAQPNTYKTLCALPAKGNGLGLHYASGKLYATSEGFFVPGRGAVFEIDSTSGAVSTFASGLNSADGLYILQSQELMFVSDVTGAKVLKFDLASRSLLATISLPNGVKSLDDMSLSADGSVLFGADFLGGFAFACLANGEGQAVVLAARLKSPTSVRFAAGPGFNASSVFVTEGGGVLKSDTSRRVLEIPGGALVVPPI
jgi:sugar lactone lactonase YvrE